MKMFKWIFAFCFMVALLPVLSLADGAGVPVAVAVPAADLGLKDFFAQIVAEFGTMKGAGLTGWPMWAAILMAALRVLISSMKVSILREWIWDKLPAVVKILVAPVLGVLVVVLTVNPISLKAVLVGLVTGAGAIALHHLFRAIESIPALSPIVASIAGFFAKILGGKLE